ncbi:MAG: hypothetical protein HYZ28_19470 [Myxococcales bacterium]|nr:hypothetical protein [Myxococcales bacterium]
MSRLASMQCCWAALAAIASGCQLILPADEVRAPRVCSPDRWCWESPLPQGKTLYSVWAASSAEAWAVGAEGTILRWNGNGWAPFLSAADSALTLYGVWGSGPSDVWAVGQGGTVLRFRPQK